MARSKKAKPTDTSLSQGPSTPADPANDISSPLSKRRAFLKTHKRKIYCGVAMSALLGAGAVYEMNTSYLQSQFFHAVAQGEIFSRTRTSSPTAAPPATGPHDKRLGYADSLLLRQRLTQNGYQVTRETRWVERNILGVPLYPIYPVQAQSGLTITDDTNTTVYSARYPYHVIDAAPQLLTETLKFVENKELNGDQPCTWNPAIEWDRTALMVLGRIPVIGKSIPGSQAGGSTLATQTEKIRYSENGKTNGSKDKASQMLTASVRAYQDGPDSCTSRQTIAPEYLNAAPFAGARGFGEVNGFADALAVWFGADPAAVMRLLGTPEAELDDAGRDQKAVAYRQALALVMALPKPGVYLRKDRAALNARIDIYLPLLAAEGVISTDLAARAAKAPLTFATPESRKSLHPQPPSKPVQSLRISFMQTLGVDSLYTLDRMHADVRTTVDGRVSEAVTKKLHSLADPKIAAENGLIGFRMLAPEMTDNVVYSFNLYERLPDGTNVLRVQTDNYNGAFDFNEQSKLELGSTAKLRTMITYLQVIEEIHTKYAGKSPEALRAARQNDPLTKFVISHLLTEGADTSLNATLEAAMQRRYAGNTGERFFTGGGVHVFGNFDSASNGRSYSVEESLQYSVNLPFVRIMRDIRDYMQAEKMDVDPAIFTDPDHPQRRVYLEKFAQQEAALFMHRAWARQKDIPTQELAAHLAGRTHKTATQLAVIYRSLHPAAPRADMEDFIRAQCANCGDKTDFERLYNDHAPGKFNLQDRAYLTRLHPMEIWIAARKVATPDLSWDRALKDSAQTRIDIYSWLINANKTEAQNTRIHTILEEEAFGHIHGYWKKLGFPFDRMTPSLASALGAAGDTPAALATMAGIVQHNGIRRDPVRFSEITLGRGTPYEKTYRAQNDEQRALSSEAACIARRAMQKVVEEGTAVRARGSVKLSDGTVLPLGGKTGTGDNREGDTVKSRTATFVYAIDDRFYGTVTVYVEGEVAAKYGFTSSLASQVFKVIEPEFQPALDLSYTITPPSPEIIAMQKKPTPSKKPAATQKPPLKAAFKPTGAPQPKPVATPQPHDTLPLPPEAPPAPTQPTPAPAADLPPQPGRPPASGPVPA